ncbi:nuclear transport factor 2 family protein [Baekduia soli]|nr:nuclear transport factor 2 family protein [Baekduia soli]
MDDIEAIKQLTARYNRAFDSVDVPGYLATWTEDGFFERSNAGRSFQGHAELEELLTTFGVDGRHVTSDFIIEVDGDRATSSSHLIYLDVDAGFKVAIFGIYADELVRTDEGWKFSARRLQVHAPKGT